MRSLFLFLFWATSLVSCKQRDTTRDTSASVAVKDKVVIYQVFTRLFGNPDTSARPWGTIEENGVGKLGDFTDTALAAIRDLGITHIWFTGIPHHALIRDYTKFGISNDDPDVVKGRAGSPYAVKDYYNVNPDLADDPSKRLQEFRMLVDRTHRHGMKVIIDIVPNHVARKYESLAKPDSVLDFGVGDDTSVVYHRDNSFYYIPSERFRVPDLPAELKPLGGEAHPLSDGKFEESPAKWTGNGSRLAQPKADDWYETVKLNYGVSPEGVKEFDTLPTVLAEQGHEAHHAFWAGKKVPATWKKFRDIAWFWLEQGVDGFRFDMAEMVPVEFWSYLNSAIKSRNPGAILVAEIYNPAQYRNYIRLGKMDYLYDKVEFYDSLRHIIEGRGSTDHLVAVQEGMKDIEHHMLHFLENHDEQRIASTGFAGNAEKAKPALVVSALISSSPLLVYFGQELGEAGEGDAGFGNPTRTSIFDYTAVPSIQRWRNGGKFDGGQLRAEEKELRRFYRNLLRFTQQSPAVMGQYQEIHRFNRDKNPQYSDKLFAFARWQDQEHLLVAVNFGQYQDFNGELLVPAELLRQWALPDGSYHLQEVLTGNKDASLEVKNGQGTIRCRIASLGSLVYKLNR